jgi:hypothetical protein
MRFKEIRSGPPWHKNARPICGSIRKDHVPKTVMFSLLYRGCDYYRVDQPCIHRVICSRCGILLEKMQICPNGRRGG